MQIFVILTIICNVNTPLSTGCPTVVTITPSTGTFEAGDVLSCSANGYLPTYTWTGIAGVNGDTVSETGDEEYTLPEGPFYVICTATVSQLSCCDSLPVSGTAYSTYQKQHNPLVTILIKQEAQLPQRNSASAGHMEGG